MIGSACAPCPGGVRSTPDRRLRASRPRRHRTSPPGARMVLFDLPLDELRGYRPARDEPSDFDAFWKRTLDEAAGHDLAAEFRPHDASLTEVQVYDASFAGWDGRSARPA
ncbi:acetylxylan esterase [Streptomyces sp. NPDC020917]|uniref:acetylxylan esterase n=1 Tax=Streptomyces sp. NPDC020917 TaxID=3365102 RepID=UPI00379D8BA7